jgi:hypothetical protein
MQALPAYDTTDSRRRFAADQSQKYAAAVQRTAMPPADLNKCHVLLAVAQLLLPSCLMFFCNLQLCGGHVNACKYQ